MSNKNIDNKKTSDRKKVVMNEHYYDCKKKSLIKRSAVGVSIILGIGTLWYIKEVPVKAEMIINNKTIEWTTENDNLKGITFQVLKNGELVCETSNLKYIDEDMIDKIAPNDIEGITTSNTFNNFKVTWKEPIDTGENSVYQVFAVNKIGRKLYKTNEEVGIFSSGVDKYIVKFNDEEFETENPEFLINTENLIEGNNVIEIKVIDKSGNESNFKKFDFMFEKVNFEFKDNKLVPTNEKYTNENYNFYMIDESLASSGKEIAQYDKNMFLLNQDIFTTLSSSSANSSIPTPSYDIKDKKINLKWSNSKSNTKTYSFYVEVVNKETLDRNYSDLITVQGSNKMLGYYYAFNTSSSYEVKTSDKYISENSLSIDTSNLDKKTKYYFHIASMDNNGLLSNTKTLTIDLKKSSSDSIKKDILKSFVSKTSGTTYSEYNKVLNAIAKKFSIDEIKKLNSDGVKIHLIKDDNFKEYVLNTYNLEVTNDTYAIKNKSIYFDLSKSSDSLTSALSSFVK